MNENEKPAPTTPLPGTPDPATVLGPDQPGGLGTGFSTTWNEPPAAPVWDEPAGRTRTEPAPVLVPERRPFRMRTMVLGLILLVAAGAVLLAQVTSVRIDPGVVVLGVMVGAGLMLIAGAARS